MQELTTLDFIDFLNDLKEEINIGKSKNDLKTLINQKIKSLNQGEPETVTNNKGNGNDFYCRCECNNPSMKRNGCCINCGGEID